MVCKLGGMLAQGSAKWPKPIRLGNRSPIARMNQTPNAIRKENVNLFRFDDCCDLALAEFWMQYGLPFAISACPVVWSAFCGKTPLPYRCFYALEPAARATLRAVDSRDLTLFTDRQHNVPFFFTANNAQLLDAITQSVLMLFLFHDLLFSLRRV